jgi:hypothetical protein
MRKLLLLALFVPACATSTPPIEPGEASVIIQSASWLQGDREAAWLSWPNATVCHFEDWFCMDDEAATVTVLSAECRGCMFVSDPTGKTGWGTVSADAIATADGEIVIAATLRFDATGETRRVVGSVIGDHGVELEATCYLVDTETLNTHRKTWTVLDHSQLRDCTTARSSTDTIVVLSSMLTAHGNGYPACRDCKIKLIITPKEADWGELPGMFEFAILPPLRTATTVTLSASQPAGELLTTSFEIPPAQ